MCSRSAPEITWIKIQSLAWDPAIITALKRCRIMKGPSCVAASQCIRVQNVHDIFHQRICWTQPRCQPLAKQTGTAGARSQCALATQRTAAMHIQFSVADNRRAQTENSSAHPNLLCCLLHACAQQPRDIPTCSETNHVNHMPMRMKRSRSPCCAPILSEGMQSHFLTSGH